MRYEIKKTIFIYMVISVCIGISLFAFLGKFDANSLMKKAAQKGGGHQLISYFEGVSYYELESSLRKNFFRANNLIFDNTDFNSQSIALRGNIFGKDGKVVEYSANASIYNSKKNEITLEENVVISSLNSKIVSDKAKYNTLKEVMTNWGNVKSHVLNQKNGDRIVVFSNKVVSNPFKKISEFSGNVRGHIKRKKVYEDTIKFKALKLMLDLNSYTAELLKEVYLQQRGYVVRADRGEIYLDNYNKNLKYYVLYDDVKISEKLKLKNGKTTIRTGYAEKIEGIISEEKIILSGNPKVFQDGDVIKGNVITLRENSEVVEIDDAITNFILK